MNKEPFNRPPTPSELAEIYMHSAENDPTSLSYKRVLVRPKVPIGKLLLCLFLLAGVGIASYIAILHFSHNSVWATVGAVVSILLVGLLLAKTLLIALVKTYQALAPDKVRLRCRYEPSCSVYMIQAVEKYGFWKGFIKGMKRWHSCKPPNGGFDPP